MNVFIPLRKTPVLIAMLLLFTLAAATQVSSPPPAARTQPAGTTPIPPMSDLTPLLGDLQQAAQNANVDIAKLRIEKWKTEGSVKQQAQQNADSISRNITAALPGMIEGVRNSPQSLAAAFKLYRNVGALYDVFASLAESAGAFGQRAEYDALARDVGAIDNVRRALGDRLAEMAAFRDGEVTRLRTQLAQATAAPPPPPKKIVVDDEEKPKKPAARKKKPAAKPAATAGTPAPANTPPKQ